MFTCDADHIASQRFVRGRSTCFVIVLLLCLSADPVTATTIALKRTRDFIVVAADSRVTGDDGRPRAYAKCKITRLDDYNFFTSVGVVSARSGSGDGQSKFSADAVARQFYGAANELRVAADQWAAAMTEKFNAQQLSWKRSVINTLQRFHVEDHIFAQGIFATARPAINAWQMVIHYDQTPHTITFSSATATQIVADEALVKLWGTVSGRTVVQELLQGRTPRAATWRASVAKQEAASEHVLADRNAFELKSALDYAIATGVDPAIGGDVAVLILERDRPARWFSKPSVCSE
jgi:hypothetical protein